MRDFPSLGGIEQASERSIRSGDVEYVQYGLAPGIYSLMKEQVRLGAHFKVIAAERKGVSDYESVDDIEIYRVKRPYNLTASMKIRKLDKTAGIDIVHAHATSGIIYALLSRMIRWKPSVVHVHGTTAGVVNAFEGLSLTTPEKGVKAKLSTGLSLSREKIMWKSADRLIAVSNNIADELGMFYHIPSDRIHVVYNGVDVDFFKPVDLDSKKPIRKELKIQGNPMILYVGYLGPRKGLEYLLKAVSKVIEKFPEAIFVLLGGVPRFAGRTDYQKVLDDFIVKLGISNNVLFAGEVKHRDTLKFYAAADAFVFPTLYEGLPKALLEAMACGLPVIATKAGGNPDAVIHGETGLLTEAANSDQLAEASIHVLSNRSLAMEMGTKGRERVKEHFTWKATAKKIMAIYEELLTND